MIPPSSLRVRFAFVGEGSSDRGLIRALEALCVRFGAAEASGFAPSFDRLPKPVGHAVVDRLRATLALESQVDLICVHRDADSADSSTRRSEITVASEAVVSDGQVVPVVPIQETEAWLLLDADAIRRASGNPSGTVELDLPPLKNLESLTSPKERLVKTICVASELSGRRLRKLRADFPTIRQSLLEAIDIDGPVRQLPAWKTLEHDLRAAINVMTRRAR